MKKNLNFATLFLATILVILTSCNDETQYPSSPVALIAGQETVSLLQGDSKTVKIKTGNGGYKVSSSDKSIVNAIVDGYDIIITSSETGNIGDAIITVSDAAGKKFDIKVTVAELFNLTLDPASCTIGTGKSKEIRIMTGNGDYWYTIEAGDQYITVSDISNDQFTVCGKAPGEACLTVWDERNKSASLRITVEEANSDITTNVVDLKIIGTQAIGKFTILTGNGGYSVKSNNDVVASEINGNEVTVTAQKTGTSIITITDAKGEEAEVNVSVVKAAMNLSDEWLMYCAFTPVVNENAELQTLKTVTYEIVFKLNSSNNMQTLMGLEGNLTLRSKLEGSNNYINIIAKQEGKENSSGVETSLYSETPIINGKWYHAALVFDANQLTEKDKYTLYINGVKQTLVGSTGDAKSSFNLKARTSPDKGLMLGRVFAVYRRCMRGAIAEARVWSTVRTQSEIQANMNGLTESNPTGLLGAWDFSSGISANQYASVSGAMYAIPAVVCRNYPAEEDGKDKLNGQQNQEMFTGEWVERGIIE